MLAAAERSGWLEMIAQCSLAVGDCAAEGGDAVAAQAAFARAFEVADAAGMPAPRDRARQELDRLDRT